MIEHDRLLREGACQRDQIADLRMVEPGIEAEPQPAQRGKAFPKLGVVAIKMRRRIGVRIVDFGGLVVPGRRVADALEARPGRGHVGSQDLFGTCPDGEIDQANDAGSHTRWSIGAARRHGGNAVDELGLAQGAQFAWTIGAVTGRTFDEDRAFNAVAAARVRQQISQQVAVRGKIPQMMMRIDDRQLRFQDFLAHLRQPVLANARGARGNRALRLIRGHASSLRVGSGGFRAVTISLWRNPTRRVGVGLVVGRSRQLPAAGGPLVAPARFDPGGPTLGIDLFFPERCARLEVVHQELRGAEGSLAMLRGGDDQHDVVAGLEGTHAMQDKTCLMRPTRVVLRILPLQYNFGHAGVVLERHAGDGLALVVSAHASRKADDGTDVGAPGRQPCDLGSDLEVGGLYAYAQAQPPVTGGKKAISEAPAMLAPRRTCVRSMAARITSARRKASAYSGPRAFSQSISSATVVTPAGRSICSSALPVFSRTQAKYKSFTCIGARCAPSSGQSRCARRP